MAAIIDKKEEIFKLIILFILYLFYTTIVSSFLSLFSVDGATITFVADLIFFIGIIYAYRKDLKEDLKDFINFNLKKKLLIIAVGITGIILINILIGVITEQLFPGQDMTDENTNALYNSFGIATIATIFKITLFSAVAEQLVFVKSIRNVIDNKKIFVLISGLIYALMNIAYVNFNLISVIDLVKSFLFGIFIASIFVKTDNIVATMLIKIVYVLLPLTIMLVELGV